MRSKLSSVRPHFASFATLVAALLIVATNADAPAFANARFSAEHGYPTTENPMARCLKLPGRGITAWMTSAENAGMTRIVRLMRFVIRDLRMCA
jgi:hypothetical protein